MNWLLVCKSIVSGLGIVGVLAFGAFCIAHDQDGVVAAGVVGAVCLIAGVELKDVVTLLKSRG